MKLIIDDGDTKERKYDLGDYVSEDCPNCGRQRLCICENGKHRCEKCNWVVEENMYCEFPLRG